MIGEWTGVGEVRKGGGGGGEYHAHPIPCTYGGNKRICYRSGIN